MSETTAAAPAVAGSTTYLLAAEVAALAADVAAIQLAAAKHAEDYRSVKRNVLHLVTVVFSLVSGMAVATHSLPVPAAYSFLAALVPTAVVHVVAFVKKF